MMRFLFGFGLPLLVLVLQSALPEALAQADLESRVRELEAKIRRMEKRAAEPSAEDVELAKLQLQLQLPSPLGKSYSGLPPGVSRIYSSVSPIAIGGFADLQYIAQSDGNRTATIAEFNPYLGWRFSEGLVFNAGLSFTDAGQPRGQVRTDFAYLDLLTGNEGGLRIGQVILPFGLTAYRFEPNLYPTVTRPRAERLIIPAIWSEMGLLGYGKIGSVLIQGGIVNAGWAETYQSGSWIAGGRQFGSQAKAANPAFVLRAEAVTETTNIGVSLYAGNSSQANGNLGDARVLLGALHGELVLRRFQAKLLYTEGALSDTDRIFAVTTRAIGARARGGYAIVSYDVLPRIAPFARSLLDSRIAPSTRELPLFLAYEYDNVQAEPAVGQPYKNDFETSRVTFGLNYLPHPQVALKADVAHQWVGSGTNLRIFELGVAAVF